MVILLLLLATLFNISAQLTLKLGVARMGASALSLSNLYVVASSPLIWFGAVLYGASFLSYIFALSRGSLSQIGVTAQVLTIIGLIVVSVIFFHEPLTYRKLVGVTLSVIGIYIVLR